MNVYILCVGKSLNLSISNVCNNGCSLVTYNDESEHRVIIISKMSEINIEIFQFYFYGFGLNII